MKNTAVRTVGLVMAALLAVTAVPLSASFTYAAEDSIVTIYHTNDIHGKLNSQYAKDGSLSQIGMDVLATARAQTADSLLVDSGDVSQGQLITTQTKGSFAFTMMNAAGYDLMCLGNHEFDYGTQQLLKNVQSAKFPVLAANVKCNGSLLLKNVQAGINGYDGNGASVIKTVAGKKIGFFGITTTETAYKTNPVNISGITFDKEIQTAQAQSDALRAAGAQVVVGVMHVGIDDSSSPTSTQVAQSTTGIDVILDGHSHSVDARQVKNKDGSRSVCIDQTGTGAAKVGIVKINVAADGTATSTATNEVPANFGKQFAAKAEVTKLYADADSKLDSLRKTAVATSRNALYGGTYENENVCRAGETNLGSLVADAMCSKAKELVKNRSDAAALPVVALENGGGVRTTLPAGQITVADVNAVLPFGNTIAVKEVTPAVLYQVLEVGTAGTYQKGRLASVGGFPQVGGMRFELDVSKAAHSATAAGSRVRRIVLLDKNGHDTKVLSRTDSKTKLLLASNDFLIAGGDGFTMLQGLKSVAESEGLDQITQAYMQDLNTAGSGSFRFDSTGRCTVYNAGLPLYSTVQVSTERNSAELLVSVDGGRTFPVRTDANGNLTLSRVKAGGHTVEYYDMNKKKLGEEFSSSLLGLHAVTSALPYVSDTTGSVHTKVGSSYFALVTLPQGTSAAYTCGSGSVLATLAKPLVRNADGTVSWLVGYRAKKAGQAGLYLTVGGLAYRLYSCTAA